MAKFDRLVGKTIARIYGMEKDSDSVVFVCECGAKFRMHHIQSCCEDVTLADVCGDVSDLIGSEVLLAEESSSSLSDGGDGDPSTTWTFYLLATAKGYVTLRWIGQSNGYYSEEVDFQEVEE